MSYDWQVTLSKVSPKHNSPTFGHLIGFSHNNFDYFGCGTYNQVTLVLFRVCITGCNEFASNKLCVSSHSTIVSLFTRSTS